MSDLFNLEPEEREQHVCTHQDQRGGRREDDVASATGSDIGPPRTKAPRAKQPSLEVVRDYMATVDTCLEKFTDAVTVICSTLSNDADKQSYQDHMIVWNEHCEELKERAREVIFVLAAARQNTNTTFSAVSSVGTNTTAASTQESVSTAPT